MVRELKDKPHFGRKKKIGLSGHIHKHVAVLRVVLVLVVVLLLFAACAVIQTPKKTEETPKACFKHGVCVDLIVSVTRQELETGLSNYSSLPEDTGMLFVLREPEAISIWTRGMQFPIDIIWLDKNKRVIDIEKSVEPCNVELCETFQPADNIKYVLETNAGFAKSINLFERDVVELKGLVS